LFSASVMPHVHLRTNTCLCADISEYCAHSHELVPRRCRYQIIRVYLQCTRSAYICSTSAHNRLLRTQTEELGPPVFIVTSTTFRRGQLSIAIMRRQPALHVRRVQKLMDTGCGRWKLMCQCIPVLAATKPQLTIEVNRIASQMNQENGSLSKDPNMT
jgi:hypothetical protein